MSANFIHLNVHSDYSLVDSVVSVKALLQQAKTMGYPAVALTDVNNLFAMVKFYRAAVSAGVKPIIGAEVRLATDFGEPVSQLLLLCQNQVGYRNLTRLISRAYLEGQVDGTPLVLQEWLQAEKVDGLIALSGAEKGDIGQALLLGDTEAATEKLQYWRERFPGRFYLELRRTGQADQQHYIEQVLPLAEATQTPVVATNAVRFLQAQDFTAHEARVCIQQGWTLADPKRPQTYGKQQWFKPAADMERLFADIPSSLHNSVEIAKRCTVVIELGETYLPNFPVPAGMTVESYLATTAEEGLNKRLQESLNEASDLEAVRKPYLERLAIELDVINSMGFSGYFLIVADFIRWAKSHGIPVGPGRGSGAGSVVAYALQITDLDPLEHELLFERFLNPERVSMPDFDIDFCMEGRDRVIEYVAERYGRASVSQIITYGTMAAKAVVRDVGRVLGHSYGFVDKIAKLIPFELGITLDKALKQEPLLQTRYQQEEEVRELITLAKKLEGLTRNAGKHAGGVVIAPSKLTDFAPLYCESGSQAYVTQFDKDDVEAIGLVKFDFLGLRTLTIIDWVVKAINQNHPDRDLVIDNIPLDDDKTYQLLKDCNTTAVFQLESRGMKDLIRRLKPDCFEEIVALVALFRPGPLQSGMVDDFIDRKHGRAVVEYPHPALETILKPTYGVILYQEQVMQIAQILAGYTLGGADILRRAMGKKKPEEMAKQRAIFMEGAVAKGVKAATAKYIFDLMEKFAGYGFNKSHSAAYALLSYQTAWLKTHYPAEFMAAVLSSDMHHTDKVVTLIEDCRQTGLTVLPPDVNSGQYKFVVNEQQDIVYGLGAIKGVGEAAIENIIEARADKPFTDLFDLCNRIDLRKVNKRVFESLIKSGAMDKFQVHRASLLASLARAHHLAEQRQHNLAAGQADMFGELTTDSRLDQVDYVAIREWSDEERLQGEKDTLGLYLTGHPLDRYQAELVAVNRVAIADCKPTHNQTITVAGLIVAVRTMLNKRGNRMAFITLDDKTGRMEIAVFSDTYETYRPLVQKDSLVVVTGEISVDEYSGGYRMSCKDMYSMAEAREVYTRGVRLHVKSSDINDNFIERLKQTLQPFKQGACPVVLRYYQDAAHAELNLGLQWQVSPMTELINELNALLGEDNVELIF